MAFPCCEDDCIRSTVCLPFAGCVAMCRRCSRPIVGVGGALKADDSDTIDPSIVLVDECVVCRCDVGLKYIIFVFGVLLIVEREQLAKEKTAPA